MGRIDLNRAKSYKKISLKNKSSLKGIYISSIGVLGFIFFYIIPFFLSLTNVRFKQMGSLFSSDAFRRALVNTLKFIGVGVPLLFLLSIVVAVLMNKLFEWKVKGRGILMALHIVPMLIPAVIVAFVLRIFLERYGIVNGFLHNGGIRTVDWLYSSSSFWILILIFIWKNYGYCTVIIMGGLQVIPQETIEAAKLDGAKGMSMLMKIILPQIKNYLIFTGMIGMIGIFKLFKESYMLFGNYPDESIYMMQNFMNNCMYALNYNRLAMASVIMIVVLSIVVLLLLYQDEGWRGEKGKWKTKKVLKTK